MIILQQYHLWYIKAKYFNFCLKLKYIFRLVIIIVISKQSYCQIKESLGGGVLKVNNMYYL